MNAAQLKASILQLAVQGRLVEQDPNDEPASALLDRIRAEKDRLIADGKIKKEKTASRIYRGDDGHFYEQIGTAAPVCIDDELPFEIPESWEWVRLGIIMNIVSARRVHQSEWQKHGIPFYRAREIKKLAENGYVENELFISQELFDKYAKNGLPKAGDIMVTAVGTLGYPYIVKKEDKFYYKDASVVCFENYGNCDSNFIKFLIMSPFMVDQIKSFSAGTTVDTLTMAKANQYLIPLPPLAEQRRIVAKIDELMPLVADFDKVERELSVLEKDFPDALKKSILQDAVQGRLVPQDASDEPASALLERIREEKERLIAEGKIKREKTPSRIYRGDDGHFYEQIGTAAPTCIDDELPFEIPETWEWVRLESICTKIVDGDHNPPKGESIQTIYLMLSSTNVNNNALVELEKVRYLSEDIFQKEHERTAVCSGDVFLTTVGSLGRSCVYSGGLNITFQRSVSIITTLIFNYYLKFFFDCGYFQNKITREATGTAQKGFYLNQLAEVILPLPPLSEQHRIVAKIDELSSTMNNIIFSEKGA